ncbi:MAG TPA: hypothetical protein VN898_02120 [Candidatus Binatia bacterium]|nr:hypothetical protein [Candidatus Binatia bacterium]
MKRGSKGSGFIACVAITALTAAPILAKPGGGMTTADLALQMARAAGISLPTDASPQAALESLGKTGIHLGSDLKAPVTEKVLVQVGSALGARVSTSRPEAEVTPAAGNAFIQSLKGPLQSAAAASGQGGKDLIHASCQGRESREARQGAPASPSSFNATAGPCEEPAS